MSLRSRRCLQLLLPMIAVMCLSAAPQQQLNPTVKVLPTATSTVPPECEEGLAPQARPRVTAEEKIVARQIVAPPEMQAPPSNDLRTTLRDVQTAAERNDRASFVDALARVKTILATYPSGAERTAAEKAVAVYNDLNTLWDYQLTPPGAFFDASSDLFKMLSAYPGYDTFIRRQVLVDQAGSKFYPSSESRAFLTQIAAARIKDLGIKTATAPTATPAAAHKPAATAAAHEKAPVVHEKTTSAPTTEATPPPHKRHTTSAAPKTQHAAKPSVTKKKPGQVAEAKPAAAAKKPAEATNVKKSAAAEKAPTVATMPAPTETKTAAPATATVPHVEQPVASTTGAPAATQTASVTPVPMPSPTTTASAPLAGTSSGASSATTATTGSETTSTVTATDSTVTAATADTAASDTTGTSEKEQQGRPGEPRNLLWPIILIVVGVGVLILLFRTSPGPK